VDGFVSASSFAGLARAVVAGFSTTRGANAPATTRRRALFSGSWRAKHYK